MKNIFAALPTEEISHKILSLREELISKGWSKKNERVSTLPHATLCYLTSINTENLSKNIIPEFSKVVENISPIKVGVTGVDSWNRKLVLKLDNTPLTDLIIRVDKVFRKYRVSWNNIYLAELNKKRKALGQNPYTHFSEAIGGHMKIARCVSDRDFEEAFKHVKGVFSGPILFNRLVLMSLGCEEEDIRWEKKL